MGFAAQEIRAAQLHLRGKDPIMKALLKRVGPFTLKPKRDHYKTLVQSIVSQQISSAAAKTILGRLEEAVAPHGIVPEHLGKFSIDQLRAVGVSNQKANYVLDLSSKILRGEVRLQGIGRKSDEEVISELIQVKGIGRWTAQMFLIFSLGRLDVLATDDLGLKTAVMNLYSLEALPSKDEFETIAEPWRPYATVASWYLWRSLEPETNS